MILLDTGILAAYICKQDENHERAVKLLEEILNKKYGTPIITDYILDEVVTLLYIRTKRKELAIEVGTKIVEEKIGKYFKIPAEVIEKTWLTYKILVEKGLSFTDCSIIEFGKFVNCETVATFDGGFKGIVEVVS